MTDTRTFKTIACHRATGQVKVFYGVFSIIHHARAVAWLDGV